MPRALPRTPAEALDISTLTLRVKLYVTVKLAELFGFWKSPRKDAATDLTEMDLTDIYYWVYKCLHPVTRTEDGKRFDERVNTDHRIVTLPAGFSHRQSLTLAAAGDILRARGIEPSKGVLFESISDSLFGKDIAYANFESPITTQPLKEEVISDREPPTECCSREQFDILKGHDDRCFDVLNIANNHIFDMGLEGIKTTLKVFAEEGILDSGTNARPEQHGKGRVLIRNGIKVGFVACTFGLNGRVLPSEEAYRVNVARLSSKHVDPELDNLKQQIDDCKRDGCDFIVASLHWGFEFEMFPREKQIEAAHELVEYGADMLLCHHNHVIQPVEYYRTRRDPDRVAVIAYSLGSLTWGYSAPHIALSILLNVTLTKGVNQGRDSTYIESVAVTPLFRSAVEKSNGVETRIEKLADHLHKRSRRHDERYINEIKYYAELVLGKAAVRATERQDGVASSAR